MNRAPEAVDKAAQAVRRAEHMLTAGAEDVAAKTRRTRRKLARKAKATRKDMAKAARKAKGTIQEMANLEPAKRRRRWPWLLALGVAAAGTVVVVRSRSGSNEEVFTPEPRAEDELPEQKQQENGQRTAKQSAQPNK